MTPLYLDHNATTPMRREACDAMHKWLGVAANPSSVHQFGRRAKAAIETARQKIAADLMASPSSVIFTSGGTEACNQAVRGWSEAPFERIYVSAIEHEAVRQAAAQSPYPVFGIPVSAAGQIDCQALDRLICAHGPGLVCTMLANNETGVIQPMAEIVEIARGHGALVFCDATQAVGKIEVSFAALGVDMLAISAHKFGGPVGVGALIIRPSLPIAALIAGGGQELRRRGGTENVGAICAMAEALHHACASLAACAAPRDACEQALMRQYRDIVIFGAASDRLPNTSCFAIPGLRAETMIMALDLAGIALSSGSACSSGKVAPSHVLQAMGVATDLSSAALRVSWGWSNDGIAEVDHFMTIFTRECERQLASRGSTPDLGSADAPLNERLNQPLVDQKDPSDTLMRKEKTA